MRRSTRVMLTGGGTGGHVYPALTVVAAAGAAGHDVEFRWIGTATGLERGIIAKTHIPFDAVEAGAFRGRSPVAIVGSVFRNARGAQQALHVIRQFRPDAVLATGGFVCVPVILAARVLRIPSVIYLPDLRPGWAVRFLARFASAVAVSFDEVVPHIPSRRVVVTGYPVRAELGNWDSARARDHLGLPPAEPVILVLGGSRGARSINEAMFAAAAEITRRATVVHATGQQHFGSLQDRLRELPPEVQARYHLYSYLEDELAPALAAASVVVARAGASVLGELPRVGVPGLLIPGPFAGTHQALNAGYLADRGAAVVVRDEALPEGTLSRTLIDLLDHPERLATMSACARRLARPDAADLLLSLVEQIAGVPRSGAPRRRSQ